MEMENVWLNTIVVILLALNQLKSEGITTEVHAWNVPKGADIRNTLLEPNASKLDVIFGPLYSEQVKPLADFCRAYDITRYSFLLYQAMM